MSFTSRKNLLLFGFIFVLLAAIPLTVYIVQKQQETKIRAIPATTLSFSPSSSQTQPIQKKEGDIFSMDVMINPGTNLVNTVILKVSYDPDFLSPIKEGSSCSEIVCANPSSIFLKAQEVTDGEIAASFSKEMDISRVIQSETKLATIWFKALKQTTTPTQVNFSSGTIVSSQNIEGGDDPSENALSTKTPAFIEIVSGAEVSPTLTPTSVPQVSPTLTGTPTRTPTPTPTKTPTPTPTRTPTPTPTPTLPPNVTATPTPTLPTGVTTTITPTPFSIGSASINEPPVCTSFNIDREPTGDAPFSIAFTATGTDIDGNITKVVFDFGDGPVQNITQGGDIGTDSISVQVSHTYQNPGTFQASAILTDDRKGRSDQSSCTQTLTVTRQTSTIGSIQPIVRESLPPGVQPTLPPGVQPTLKPVGPSTAIFGLGIGGFVLSILGALIFLAL